MRNWGLLDQRTQTSLEGAKHSLPGAVALSVLLEKFKSPHYHLIWFHSALTHTLRTHRVQWRSVKWIVMKIIPWPTITPLWEEKETSLLPVAAQLRSTKIWALNSYSSLHQNPTEIDCLLHLQSSLSTFPILPWGWDRTYLDATDTCLSIKTNRKRHLTFQCRRHV